MSNYVITIGRQYGCGGREIGRQIADMLGIAYYDKELLYETSQHCGVDSKIIEAADEHSPSFFDNIGIYNIGINSSYVAETPISNANIYKAMSESICKLASKGPCVIVGRTADYILRDKCQVISVFVHSSIEDRVQRIIARGDSDSESKAKSLAEKMNKKRAEYYNFYTDKQWGDASSYDLCVNSSVIGTKDTAALIVEYVKLIVSI